MDYGGNAIFGLAVSCQMVQAPSEAQLNTFFGISGVQSLYGGGRGRAFLVSGWLVGTDASDLASAYGTFLSYDDGVGRTLTDTYGTAWSRVVFRRMEPIGIVQPLAGGGLAFPYRAVFEGLV